MATLKVGDIVAPIDANRPLMCSTKVYPHAIVCSLFPFILVSECTEMRWSKREQHQFNVIGTASDKVLHECINRIKRDFKISTTQLGGIRN